MFDRRNKIPLVRRVLDFFWPSMGFKRSTRYLGYRLARLPGTSYSLAAGFAFGAAVSFTPFVGLHFILGGLFAWIFRANILASAIGTAVGNPWTFPFIWTATYHLGYWLLGWDAEGKSGFSAGTMDQFFHNLMENGWASVTEIFTNVIFPMIVGSVPFFIIVWILFYYPLNILIRNFHMKRAEALQASLFRREQEAKALSEAEDSRKEGVQ
ncbi:DUF2062 domain-containing protein [Sneathiella limimaris]|uniref:DUF2062 domain-containing protein n=1 Tax=Sneathiella limimaris TaxID=1964213 RepID=UPI00146A2FB0|nr:DUF2062 domain-containing protein [Sneathiella limimaris]